MLRRNLRCLLVACVVVGVGVSPARAAEAVDLDPIPTRVPVVTVLGASAAGVLYRAAPADGSTPPINWVKPTGGTAYQVPGDIDRLAGSWMFGLDRYSSVGATYQQIGTSVRGNCGPLESTAFATSFGWITARGERIEVSSSGCAVTARLPAHLGVLAADEFGYVDYQFLDPSGIERMTYYSYADPAHPHVIADGGYNREISGVDLVGSSISWRSRDLSAPNQRSFVVRGRTDGSAPRLLATLEVATLSTSIAGGSTGYLSCPYTVNCVAGSIDADGTRHQLDGIRSLVSDGTRFVFDNQPELAVEAAAAVDPTSPRTRLATVPLLPPVADAVSLGAGGVAYLDSQTPGRSISQRGYGRSGSTITLSGQTRVAQGGAVARDGRRTAYLDNANDLWIFRDDGVRTKVFTSSAHGATVAGDIKLSGTRLLWWKAFYTGETCDHVSCYPDYSVPIPMLYNVATGVSSQLTGPVGRQPATLWGSYLAYADASQAIWRRDLSSNALVQVKPPGGSPIVDIAANDDYVAWSICQPNCEPSMVTYRNVATKAAAVQIVTYNTGQIAMSGGHVLFSNDEDRWTGTPVPTLEELRLGTKTVSVIGLYRAGARFSVHDETLAWVGRDGMAKISPNSSFVAPPRFLGNTIGTASFSPAAGPWTPEFPISKALTSCTMTIKSGTTVRRVLTCPTTVGSARPSWNGLDSAGHLVAKGTYSWTLTASDSDGTLRWWTNATHAIAGTVRVT